MKKQAKLLLLILVAVAVLCSTLVITMATSAAADDPAYSIYLADPSAGDVTPDYSGSDDLYTKLCSYRDTPSSSKSYVNKDVWVVLHKDVELNCTSALLFGSSAYFDLGGNTLTLSNADSDNCMRPMGVSTEDDPKFFRIWNGNIVTTGANKIAYAQSGSTAISLTDVKIDTIGDCFDIRSTGSLTVTRCTVNFVGNYKTKDENGEDVVQTVNRFAASGNPSGTLTINIDRTTFNVSKDVTWASKNRGALFNFNHTKGYSTTELTVTNSYINVEEGSNLTAVLITGGTANVIAEMSNTQINCQKRLLWCNDNSTDGTNKGGITFTFGDGLAFSDDMKSSAFGTSANYTLNYASGDGSTKAYVTDKLEEYVAPDQAVTVTYYYNGQELGSRFTKIGAAPIWNVEFENVDTFVDGVLYHTPTEGVYYSDAEKTDRVKNITAETETLYVAPGKGTPYVWAAFSGEPSATNVVVASTDSNEIVSAVTDYTNVKYIYGYADISLTLPGDSSHLLTRDLTIDAFDHKLVLNGADGDAAFNPDEGVTLTIKNATITSETAKIAYPQSKKCHIVLENLIINWTNIVMFDYRAGGTFTANNCEFNYSGTDVKHSFYLLHVNKDKDPLEMTFNDCRVNMPEDSKVESGFVRVGSRANATTYGHEIVVNFNGGNFDVHAESDSLGLFSNASSNITPTVNFNMSEDAKPMYVNTTYCEMVVGTSNVNLGNGIYFATNLSKFIANSAATVTYADGVAWAETGNTTYPNLLTNAYNTVTFNDGNDVTERLLAPGYSEALVSTYSYVVEKVGTVNKAAESVTGWFDENGNVVTTLAPTADMTLYGKTQTTGKYALWAIFNNGETKVLQAGATDILPAGTINAVGEGCVLRIYADVTYDHGTGTDIGGVTPGTKSTIDLGGHTLKLIAARLQAPSSKGAKFTVKDGTVDVSATGNNVLFSNTSFMGTTVFDGVTFVTKSGIMPFDFRAGTLELDNCIFDQADTHFIAMASRTRPAGEEVVPISVTVVDCTVVCSEAFRFNGSTSGTPAPPYTPDAEIKVVGGTYDCDYFFSVAGKYTEQANMDLDLQGVSVKCRAGSMSNLTVDTVVTFTLDKYCRFTHDPAIGTDFNPDSVTVPAGLAVMPKANGEYAYTVGVPVFMSWNLTLYTDFKVNLYVKPDGINYVKINGVAQDLANAFDGEDYVFTMKSIAANLAAEKFTVEVGYGDGYSVSTAKSVVDYANALLASTNTDLSKKLIAAAMQYVGKAYEYANSENEESPDMPKALTDLLASKSYLAYLPEDVILENNTDEGNSDLAIKDAQLNLSSQLKFRFNLNPNYTGTLKIYGQSFNVSQGLDRATGLGYVELNIRAFALYRDTIAISGTREDGTAFSGTYSLGAYVAGVKDKSTDETKALLSALSTYVATASEYKYEWDLLDQFTYEKNGNTYIITGAKNLSGDVVIPKARDGVYIAEIAAYAFAGNTEITSVVLPSTIRTVGIGAFNGCTSLTSITLNDGLEVIGALAFEKTALGSLVIPDSVLAIGHGILRDVKTITSVTLPFVGANLSDSNNYFGYIFGASSYVGNVDYVPASLTEVVLSDACTEIPAYSFFGCTSINNVVIGAGVKVIGISAFQGCSSLESIYIPATVTSIPAKGFFYNSPFFGCADGFTVVTESEDLSAFGTYWCQLTENGQAAVASGLSYEEFLAQYK